MTKKKRTLDSKTNPHEKMESTGKGNYIDKYKKTV